MLSCKFYDLSDYLIMQWCLCLVSDICLTVVKALKDLPLNSSEMSFCIFWPHFLLFGKLFYCFAHICCHFVSETPTTDSVIFLFF